MPIRERQAIRERPIRERAAEQPAQTQPSFLQQSFMPNPQSYGEIFGQGEKTFQEGQRLQAQGNTLGAFAKSATSAAQNVMSPLAAADKALMDSGDPLATSVGIGLRAANIPVGLFSKAVGYGVDKLAGAFGANEPTKQALSQTGETYAPFALPIIGKKVGVPAAEFVGKKMGETANALEAKAIRPPFNPKKGLEVFDRQTKTALEYNFGPNRKSYERLSFGLEKLDNEAQSVASKSTATVDLKRMNDVIDNELAGLKNSALEPEVSSALEDIRSRVMGVANKYPMGNVPVSAAIELKRSLQKMASGKYDEVGAPKIEAAKIVAYELLDDITKQEPSLKNNGIKQRDLIELQGVLGRRVAQIQERPVISWRNARALGLGIGVGAGTGNPLLGFGAGLTEMAVDNPMVQHRTAVFLNRLSGGRKVKP